MAPCSRRGSRSGAIEPGTGVRLVGGELIRATTVVSNADPQRTTALCLTGGADAVPVAWRERVDAWRASSPVLKIN
jgi:phytoene dehydrogenase-like protein